MADILAFSIEGQTEWQLLAEFATANLAVLTQQVTEVIKVFSLQPAQLARAFEVMTQALERARRNASMGEPSAPVRIRIWASAGWTTGRGCGLFLVEKQEKELGLAMEEITPVVELFLYQVGPPQVRKSTDTKNKS